MAMPRVIAGSYGGRRLAMPKGKTTRPTSGRVREALFAMLGEVDGVRVLDLFAGSGALGIEALSRGAEKVVFVERDPGAIAALKANLATLGVGPEQAEVRREEAIGALGRANERKETYDLVLVDPPYGRAPELEPALAKALPGLLAERARVVLESDRRAPLRLGLALARERRYGDTEIRIYQSQ
jgi:16S rRNA (guanine966-N2)-methyltransferase